MRPTLFKNFIGQENITNQLKIGIEASKKEDRVLGHVLFYGPPGLGKTTLANIIANELEKNIVVCAGGILEKPSDVYPLLCTLNRGDVLFIDEIHRMPKCVEEALYSVMEDWALDILLRESEEKIRLEFEPFTLVGATTLLGNLSKPLKDRFKYSLMMDYYTQKDLSLVIQQSARQENFSISNELSTMLACRAKGTPRIALALLERVIDYAIVHNNNDRIITKDNVEKTISMMKLDSLGFDQISTKYLKALNNSTNGRPIGLTTLASHLMIDEKTISEVIEPYMIYLGMVEKTSRGRKLTNYGKKYLKETN